MTQYTAPVKDMMFTLTDILGMQDYCTTAGLEEFTPDTLEAVLSEGGKLIDNKVAPFNLESDNEGAKFSNDTGDGVVEFPQSLVDAWHEYSAGGWAGLAFPSEYGGQGFGQLGYVPFHEMMTSGSMSFVQAPGLTLGAMEAIKAHGTEEMRAMYFPKMASGEWTGTMNLTEPHAGSDVGALRTKAVANDDGTYKIKGNKIFITCGDTNFSENIVHLVLARLEGAPSGSRGISLFLVPKFIPNADGSLNADGSPSADGSIGERNDLRVTGIEHKLGLRGSAACAMSYGDNGGATGWLIGEENKGLACMFTMMNTARLHVGLHGVGVAERAYQMAVSYSRERVQGIPVGSQTGAEETIVNHADVRRMLLEVRAKTAASRAICYLLAKAMDMAHALPEQSEEQLYWQGLSDLITPLAKAYSSDIGVECASETVQIFGGMGFIEETGAAQLYRDSRIAPIYEGTNGIQAWDLANRKLKMNGGQHWQMLLNDIEQFAEGLDGELQETGQQLGLATAACRSTAEHFLERHSEGKSRDVAAGSVTFQRLLSETVGAWLLARGAKSAAARIANGDSDRDYLRTKITIARFFAGQFLPASIASAQSACAGDELLFADDEDMLSSF